MSEGDLTVTENQRLKKEVRELHDRLASIEASRWWRLHPRFILRGEARTPRPWPVVLPPLTKEPTTERFVAEVVERGTFTEDWFTMHIPEWTRLLARFEGRATRVLELGSYEGLSACFVLWFLPDAHITCVDTFAGITGYEPYGIATDGIEHRFDENVALVDASRVRKLVGTTHTLLPRLVEEGERFDFVYVDASHSALDVLADASLAWQLLARGGVMIFDDYGGAPPAEDRLDYPKPAVDAFVELVQAEVIRSAKQLSVCKR